MPGLMQPGQRTLPIACQAGRPRRFAEGIVITGHNTTGKGQRLTRQRRKGHQLAWYECSFHIGRGHQQGCSNPPGMAAGIVRHGHAAQAVGNDDGRALRLLQSLIQSEQPAFQIGLLPVGIFYPDGTQAVLPMALPVVGATSFPAGLDDEIEIVGNGGYGTVPEANVATIGQFL